MPPYKSPEAGSNYQAKYIRVRDKIFTTEPEDIKTGHHVLAEQDGILDEIRELFIKAPQELDAGYVTVARDMILIYGNSSMLSLPRLPVKEEARARTIVEFRRQSPHHQIIDRT